MTTVYVVKQYTPDGNDDLTFDNIYGSLKTAKLHVKLQAEAMFEILADMNEWKHAFKDVHIVDSEGDSKLIVDGEEHYSWEIEAVEVTK